MKLCKRLPWYQQSRHTWVVVVEIVGVWAYVVLFLWLCFAVAVNYHVVNPDDNPVLDWFGANSICIYIDDPPFSYFAAITYIPVGGLFCAFAVAKFLRIHNMYYAGKLIGSTCTEGILYGFGAACCVECAGAMTFVQSFATQPTQSMRVHAGAYVAFVTGQLVAGMASVRFYILATPYAARWKRLWYEVQFAAFVLNSICFYIVVVNAMGKKGGLVWDVTNENWRIFANITLKFMFPTNIFFPLVTLLMMEGELEDVTVTFGRDLSDFREVSSSDEDETVTFGREQSDISSQASSSAAMC